MVFFRIAKRLLPGTRLRKEIRRYARSLKGFSMLSFMVACELAIRRLKSWVSQCDKGWVVI